MSHCGACGARSDAEERIRELEAAQAADQKMLIRTAERNVTMARQMLELKAALEVYAKDDWGDLARKALGR